MAGSFNKTASKWGIVSPSAKGVAFPAKRLSRDCMYLPPSSTTSGLLLSPLRPLDDAATYEDITKFIQAEIRPLIAGSRARAPLSASPASSVPPQRPGPSSTTLTEAAALLASAASPTPADEHRNNTSTPSAAPFLLPPSRMTVSSSSSRATPLTLPPPVPVSTTAPLVPHPVVAPATPAAMVAGAGGLPAGMLSRIMAAVRNSNDAPDLSESQLASIFAIAANHSIAQQAHTNAAQASSANNHATMTTPIAQQMHPPSTASNPASRPPSSAASRGPTPPPAMGSLSSIAPLPPQAGGDLPLGGVGVKLPAEAPAASRSSSSGSSSSSGLAWGSLQVALWDKTKKRRISANNYKGDLDSYLRANPHLEVYNRQDATAARSGNQIVAGTKLQFSTEGLSKKESVGEPRVVLWDTNAQAKLPVKQCPTQSGLCTYLRNNPHVEIYAGQVQTHKPAPLATPTAQVTTEKKISLDASNSLLLKGSGPPALTTQQTIADAPKMRLSLDDCKPLMPRGLQRAKVAEMNGVSPATVHKQPLEGGGVIASASPAPYIPVID